MKDYTQEEWENDEYPQDSALYCINFCLGQLYEDQTHTIGDVVCNGRLTFEELIGALLLARKQIRDLNSNLDVSGDPDNYHLIDGRLRQKKGREIMDPVVHPEGP
ncbi:MAG: hypothetical protein NTV68_13625 [Methanomicrobiales archaeon]|nr:hypothetical protein [Methanomicrobiales archaeon]